MSLRGLRRAIAYYPGGTGPINLFSRRTVCKCGQLKSWWIFCTQKTEWSFE
jgi:hypothetical protein